MDTTPSQSSWPTLTALPRYSEMVDKIAHPSDKEFHLAMLTQPSQSIATEWTDDKKPRSHKKRKATEWPLEPAPVIALRIGNGGSEASDHSVLTCCPNVFCVATLTNREGVPVSSEIMRGRHSSSLFKLEKDKSPKIHTIGSPTMGVFLFDQIHIRYPGEYRLLFTLFEMQMHSQGMHAVVHNVVRSDIFSVMPQPKRLPKPDAPADILLALAAQGAKIKIRKPNEDRVKRKQDWSINTNDPEWAAQTQMMAPTMSMPMMQMPMPGHVPMMQQQNQLQQQNHIQQQQYPKFPPTTMGMTSAAYQMPIPAHAQMAYQPQNWLMQTPVPQDMPQDFNFAPLQDPDQHYVFHGVNPSQQNFDGNYGNYQ